MSDFSNKLKNVLVCSAKFIGKTANTAVKAGKYKMNELTGVSKRRDLINELGSKVFELSQNGLELPSEAAELVRQILVIDGELETLRADHAAQKAAAAEQHAAEKAARAAEKAAAKAAAAIEKSTEPVAVDLPDAEAPTAEIEVSSAETTEDVPTLKVDVAAGESSCTGEKPAEDSVPTLKV